LGIAPTCCQLKGIGVGMIEIQQPIEKVLLVGAPELSVPSDAVDEHLEELVRLTDTAGGEVVATLVQRLRAPNAATFIGRGKVDELRQAVSASGATLVVFDEDLTPAQGSALEQRLEVRVMDRTELILDIFALHARTAEAKLQVELAQLRYMRPRLKRMWTHLSRQAGIGARGPGEQQIETDRRLIDRRITRLESELKHIARSRKTRRKGRRNEFRASLVGYTNAGKSSVLRALSGTDLLVEDRLFATLDSATRVVELGSGQRALVTDTVGFIRKLPHHLVASFRATLEEVEDADLLLHVIDASANWEEQVDSVNQVLQQLEDRRGDIVLVFNKTDRLTHEEEAALRARTELLGPRVFSSAHEPEGLDDLRTELLRRIQATRPTVRVSFSSSDGRTLAEAYREGEVLERLDDGGTIVLTARVPEALLGRWTAQDGIEVVRQDAA